MGAITVMKRKSCAAEGLGAKSMEFSVPQIEYPLGGSSKKGSHVYFLLQVFWVILLFFDSFFFDFFPINIY